MAPKILKDVEDNNVKFIVKRKKGGGEIINGDNQK